MSELRFDGRVAIVTGAGGGLGREYAILLASRGAKVVVNDLGGARDGQGSGTSAADKVVNEIRARGWTAVANYDSVEDGDKIVKTAIDNFGRIDILINNAGILRDKSFLKITEEDWDLVYRVHLRGAFLVTKAAWPYFREQKYGRIVMTSSPAGIYGNFGQSNYSAAKLGLLGLSNTLSVEGGKYGIHANTILPVAASRLTEDILPKALFEKLKPEAVAPLVVYLVSEECEESGGIFEAAGGWVGRYRWQRSLGKTFPLDNFTPESVRDSWSKISSMEQATYPVTTHDQMNLLMNALNGEQVPLVGEATESANEQRAISSTENAPSAGVHRYTAEDAILYALGVGLSTREPDHLRFLYECSDKFQVLPTYGVIPSVRSLFDFGTVQEALKELKLKWDPAKLLHGEQYLELRNPLPANGVLISKPRLIEVLDKGVGALVIAECETTDDEGKPIMYNQFAIMLVGSGNFNGPRTPSNPVVKSVLEAPKRAPDVTVSEKTSIDQAALYRLSGDKNPLHIDPTFAAVGGFERPILHGLCSLGFATRHILKSFCDNDVRKFQAIKARFVGPVFPGETIRTDMWREGNRIHFTSSVEETGKAIITGSYVDLVESLADETALSNVGGGSDGDLLTASANDGDEANFLISDVVFDEMGRRASLIPTICQEVQTVYQFDVIKNGKHAVSWIFDLKNTPAAMYQGPYRNPGEPDCIIEISDSDMVELGMGILDPVRGFMSGRIKVKGNPLLSQRLNKLFELDSTDHMEGVIKADEVAAIDEHNGDSGDRGFRFDSPSSSSSFKSVRFLDGPSPVTDRWEAAPYQESEYERPPEMIWAEGGAGGGGGDGGGSGETGCKIDLIFDGWLRKRVQEEEDLVPHIKTCYQWNITKNGKIASVWTLDVKNPPGRVYRGPPKGTRPDCTLTMDDEYAVGVFEGREDAMKAFMTGKLKITGNILAAQKLQQLWAEEQSSRGSGKEDSLPQPSSSATSSSSSVTPAEDRALLDSIPVSGLKCDIIFTVFKNRMHEEPELVRRLRVIFQFNITKNGEQKAIWTADNKSTEEGDVFPGPPKNNLKPDCVITVDDDDFLKLMVGKLNPQRAFMMGKLKIKGNIMLLQKLNSLWIEFQKSGKAPEIPIISDIMLKENVIPGLRSEAMIVELIQRMARMPNLLNQAPGFMILNVTKDGKQMTRYTIDCKTRNIGCVYRGDPQGGSANTTLTLEDDDFVRITFNKLKIADAISSGKVKCEGDRNYIEKINTIFTTPTTKPKL